MTDGSRRIEMLRRHRMREPPKYHDYEVCFKEGDRDIVSADSLKQVQRVYHMRKVVSITVRGDT